MSEPRRRRRRRRRLLRRQRRRRRRSLLSSSFSLARAMARQINRRRVEERERERERGSGSEGMDRKSHFHKKEKKGWLLEGGDSDGKGKHPSPTRKKGGGGGRRGKVAHPFSRSVFISGGYSLIPMASRAQIPREGFFSFFFFSPAANYVVLHSMACFPGP